jgi:N4-gp56 family major capsid protein
MAWTFDAPSGTYKNHSLSSKIRRQAVANAVFMKFLTQEPNFGRGMGESHTITRYLKLPLAGRIGETDDLPAGRPAVSTKTVDISRWGFMIPVTEYEKQLTFYDIMSPLQATLREQMVLTMDKMAADAMKKTPIKYVPETTGFTLTTNGTPGATSDRNLGVQDLREIHDYLSTDLLCPKFSNGQYVGIVSTKAARGIKNDPEYKDWQAPSTSDPFMTGMLKSVEGFTLIETNNVDAMAALAGASTTTGEAVFFGADAAGLLQVQAPELRIAGNSAKLGLERLLGWVGILEAFLVWEQAAQARIVHVSSA